MTRDEAEARGRRALAAGFVWAVGCLTLIEGRRLSTYLPAETIEAGSWGLAMYASGIRDGDTRVRPDNGCLIQGEVPDFRDPATVGVLFAQAEERSGGALWVEPDGDERVAYAMRRYTSDAGVEFGEHEELARGADRVDALLAALEVGHEG